MKKLKYLFMCLLVALLIPSVFACKQKESKIQLSTPSFVNMIDEEDNRILVTDNNINATSYVFGICFNQEDKDNLTKYIRYSSNKNYLDVSEIFTNSTTYYFYAQAIGSGKYSNSLYSQKNSYDNTKYLSSPRLVYSNYCLSWTNIKNAYTYDVYLNNEFAFSTTSTTIDLKTYNSGLYLNSTFVLNFKVKAKPTLTSGYKESNFSNSISVSEHLVPNTPVITINKTEDAQNNNIVLNWQDSNNEIEYQLKVVGLDIKYYSIDKNTNTITLNNFYDKSTSSFINLIENVGDYCFSLQAIGENNTESGFSNTVTFKKCKTLQPCEITDCVKKDDGIVICINAKEIEAKSVHITLLDDLNNIVFESDYVLSSNTLNILIYKKDLSNYDSIAKVSVVSNGYGDYYYNSNSTTKLF